MPRSEFYFDYNATAPLAKTAYNIIQDLAGRPLNPSAQHHFGQYARSLLRDSRARMGEILSIFPQQIYFTSSATEANNWLFHLADWKIIICSGLEHPSILRPLMMRAGRGDLDLRWMKLYQNGTVDLDHLAQLLEKIDQDFGTADPPRLMILMHSSNETGVIQPVDQAFTLARRYNFFTHTDMVQSFGKLPLPEIQRVVAQADFFTLSGHKIGAGFGCGVLGIRLDHKQFNPSALLLGGGQEFGKRSSTENIPAISSLALVAQEIYGGGEFINNFTNLTLWRNELENFLRQKIPGLIFVGADLPRLPGVSAMILPQKFNGQEVLVQLDLAGFAISRGQACSSGKVGGSNSLVSMGYSEAESTNMLRISGGPGNSEREFAKLGQELERILTVSK